MTTSPALQTARVLVDELVRGGVRTFAVAPGSRSTPLVLALAERRDVRDHVITDERSLAFFALGVARAAGEPVGLVCTSGTAAANFLPAVAEACFGGGALVLLTADRPPEDRDTASPQTIFQAGLYGAHARWAVDLPMLEPGEAAARAIRSIAARAVATAREGLGGVVHVNVPLREPFVDDTFDGTPATSAASAAAARGAAAFTRVLAPALPDAGEMATLAARLREARRGVVVSAGGETPAREIAAVAAALGWPIVADPLGGLRFGDHDRSLVADALEPLLRDDEMRRQMLPDAVLRFGLTPPPRSMQRWLAEAWPAEHVVAGHGAWPDPIHAASVVFRGDPARFAAALAEALGSRAAAPGEWTRAVLARSHAARSALDQALARAIAGTAAETGSGFEAAFDGLVLARLVSLLPDDASVVVGNSMPVRDADAFLGGSPKRLRFLANRGASGIDGVLSTALGVAATSATPTALVVGDLSFLHDAAALVFAVRERIPLLVVVVNNDGGGIFSHLPVAARLGDGDERAVFERYFGTPHGADLSRVAAVAGFFRRVDSAAGLDDALAAGLVAATSGPAVVEVVASRDASRKAQLAAVAAARESARAIPFPDRRTS